MLVKDYMTPDPMTMSEDKSVLETAELMKKQKVRRFPVLRGNELVGIVTDRDLRSAAPSQVISFDAQERELMPELHSLLSNITIREVMSSDVITIRPEQTIVAAAQLMLLIKTPAKTHGPNQGKDDPEYAGGHRLKRALRNIERNIEDDKEKQSERGPDCENIASASF